MHKGIAYCDKCKGLPIITFVSEDRELVELELARVIQKHDKQEHEANYSTKWSEL